MDVALLHQMNVLQGKLEDDYDKLPEWKKKALAVELERFWEILDASDRRKAQRRD